MQQKKIIDFAKRGIELYYQQENKFFSEVQVVIGNNVLRPEKGGGCGRQEYHVVHNQYRIALRSGQYVMVVGTFRLFTAAGTGSEKEKICVASVMLNCKGPGIKVTLLHVSEKTPERKYELRDTRECCYLVEEMDVYYLEAGHNHTKWHCRSETIETVGNLCCSEKMLSDSFVRIHRGFIVNKLHVHKVGRCYVELDNGEQLQIPVKRYMTIKEQLIDVEVEMG